LRGKGKKGSDGLKAERHLSLRGKKNEELPASRRRISPALRRKKEKENGKVR